MPPPFAGSLPAELERTDNTVELRFLTPLIVAAFSIGHIVATFHWSVDLLDGILTGVAVAIRVLLGMQFRHWQRHLAGLLVWCTLDAGFFQWLAVATPESLRFVSLETESIIFSMRSGVLFLGVHFAVTLAFSRVRGRQEIAGCRVEQAKTLWGVQLAIGLIVTAFTATLVSRYFGVGILGSENPRLPFKLSGLLNYARSYWIMLVAPFVVDVLFTERRRRGAVLFVLAYFAWVLVESGVRLSRGFVVEGMLPLLFWSVLRQRLKRTYALYGAGLFGVLLVFFPIISDVRNAISDQGLHVTEAMRQSESHTTLSETIPVVVLRIFPDGLNFAKFRQHLGTATFKPHIATVMPYGTTAWYHTWVVDGVPQTVVHSSGASGLASAMLLGGYSFAVLTCALLSMLATAIDRKLVRWLVTPVPNHVMSVYYAFVFCNYGIWDWLLNIYGNAFYLAPFVLYPAFVWLHRWIGFDMNGSGGGVNAGTFRGRPSAPRFGRGSSAHRK